MEDPFMHTRSAVMVQGHVLLALIGTHPDLARLQQEFARISEAHTANVLAGEQSDASIAAYEASLRRWKHWISSAMDQTHRISTKNSTPGS